MALSKRRVYITLAVIGSVAAVLVGLGYYLQTKLALVTHGPRVELMPTMRPAKEPDFPLREIDLGYLKVSLPAGIVGEPQGVSGSVWVQIGSTDKPGGVGFLQPLDLETSGINELCRRLSAAGAIVAPDWYSMVSSVLHSESFDLWDVPRMGIQETQTKLQLLILKQMLIPASLSVRLVETDHLKLVVHTLESDKSTMIEVHDPATGSLQTILVDETDDRAEQIIDAVAATYNLQTSDLSEESIETLLQQAGVEFLPPPDAQLNALTDEDVQSRMNKVAEEIRRRRAEPQAPVRSVLVPAEDN